MKILKLSHEEAQQVLAGNRSSTIRMFDDKDLGVNDEVELLDKVDPHDRSTWRPIGVARIKMVLEKKLGDLDSNDLEEYEMYDSPAAISATLENYYGTSIEQSSAIKIIHFDFTPVKIETDNVGDKNTTVVTEVKLFADGGSRGNPGPSASGYVVYDMNDKIIAREGIYLGITTNNQAEYLALKYGLERALKEGAHTVHVYLDSLLVVNQMTGKFKVKNRDLWPIHGAIKELVHKFKEVRFTHVPRELNKEADAAVNEAMDAELERQNTV